MTFKRVSHNNKYFTSFLNMIGDDYINIHVKFFNLDTIKKNTEKTRVM